MGNNPFANNDSPGDWPDLPAEDYAEIMNIVEDVQALHDDSDDPPSTVK